MRALSMTNFFFLGSAVSSSPSASDSSSSVATGRRRSFFNTCGHTRVLNSSDCYYQFYKSAFWMNFKHEAYRTMIWAKTWRVTVRVYYSTFYKHGWKKKLDRQASDRTNFLEVGELNEFDGRLGVLQFNLGRQPPLGVRARQSNHRLQRARRHRLRL